MSATIRVQCSPVRFPQVVKLLDEFGVLDKMKSDTVAFCSGQFFRYDREKDGNLSFEEFRSFYNAAVEDAQGKRDPQKLRAISPTKMNESPTKAKRKWALQKAQVADQTFRKDPSASNLKRPGGKFF